MLIGSLTIVIFLLSIRVMSNTSLIRFSRCVDVPSIFFKQSVTTAAFSAFCMAIAVMPIIPLMGVRMSCDILAKNFVLASDTSKALSTLSSNIALIRA